MFSAVTIFITYSISTLLNVGKNNQEFILSLSLYLLLSVYSNMQYANYLSGVSCSTNFMKTEVPKKFWDEAVIVTKKHPSFNRY